MKSITNLNRISAGHNIVSDDIMEFHATRILLLILVCGSKQRETKAIKIDSLTKLAKLDFFVRYPGLFNKLADYLGKKEHISDISIESRMIRFHYGPWDKRYYQILPYLEAKNLISVKKNGKSYEFSLTSKGENIAENLKDKKAFKEIVYRLKIIKKVLGSKSGNSIKSLIYEVFDNEVAQKELESII